MISDDEDIRKRIRAQLMTNQQEPWFTPLIDEAAGFVDPDFSISQIFFSKHTTIALVDALDRYLAPCCLCTPRLAEEWFRRGRKVTLLDVDRRFDVFSRFIHYDILYPKPMDTNFDALIVDPPAFDPEWIRAVVDVLTNGRLVDLFAVFRLDQSDQVIRTFEDYALRLTNFDLAYCNVRSEYQGMFRLYGTRPEIFSHGARL